MMRALPLILLALATTPAFADPIKLTEQDGSPAIEAGGTSSTTISVLGGAASVTVEGSGSLNVYTHSGTITGQGSLGVPQLGLDVGGALGPADAPDGSGRAEDPALADTAALSADGDACIAPHANGMDADAIARIDAQATIGLAMACERETQLSADGRAAVAGNSAMTAVLAARGYRAEDVLWVEARGDGAVLVVATGD